MLIDMLKALAVGIIAAVPVGPILLMVIQKTLGRGCPAGIATGAGSAFADTVYAAVGLFTLTFVKDFVAGHTALIMIAGGVMIGAIGLNIFFREVKFNPDDGMGTMSLAGCALKAACSALSNPAALAFMLGLLMAFGLVSGGIDAPVWAVLAAVWAGEALYWVAVVFVLSRFVHLKDGTLRKVTKLSGAAILCFAAVLFIRGIILILK